MARRFLAVLALGACTATACVTSTLAQSPEDLSRRDFLQRIDVALASRDATKLSALADLVRWRTAGRPNPDRLTLWLPPAPLTRTRDLSPNEVLYEDSDGSSWRLRLTRDDERRVWMVVLPDRPCPPKSMPRGRPWDDKEAPGAMPNAGATSSQDTWTVLECWPLPR